MTVKALLKVFQQKDQPGQDLPSQGPPLWRHAAIREGFGQRGIAQRAAITDVAHAALLEATLEDDRKPLPGQRVERVGHQQGIEITSALGRSLN